MTERPELDESALLKRIASGDSEAEQLLFEHFKLYDKIRMMVRHRIQAEPDAEADLISDIIASLLINLRKGMFDPEKGSLGNYAFGIARNRIRNYLRPTEVIKRQTSEIDETHQIYEDLSLENSETAEVLSRSIKNLAIKYQQVLMLRYYENYSIPEIADQLGLSATQVYSRIHYALELLEVELEKIE